MVLRNVILQTSTGLPLFGRSLVCHIGTFCVDLSDDSTFEDDTILKSGLLTAMLAHNQAEPGKFHELDLSDSKILSFPTENLIGVMEVDPNDDTEIFQNRLKVMVELFANNYGEAVNNFDGEVTFFNSFEKDMEDHGILEEGEKFKKNCVDCKYTKSCAFRVTTGPFYKSFLEKFDSIKEIGFIWKMLLMMLGMPGMMKHGMPKKQT